MRTDAELFKDKLEVSLDSRQVFYLFFGGAVIAALVFVLGVMVGKRVEARAHVDARPATSAARDPLAALDQLSRQDDLAFSSALAGNSEEPLGPVDSVLAARAAAEGEDKAAEEKAAKAAEEKAAKAAEEKAAKAAEDKIAAMPAVKPAAAGQADDEKSDERAAQSRPRFTLQLSSFRDRAEADSFHDKLREAGYTPYVVEAEVPDKGTWYRVRLGRYDSYESAVEAKAAFEDSQHIIAYVTRIRS